jgi:multidrug efflux pump subunit AcrA (membrane-fusion protein)
MKWINASITGCILIFGATLAIAQQGTQLRPQPIVVTNCQILPYNDVRVPARVAGVIQSFEHREGSWVKAGDVLAILDDRLAKTDLDSKTIIAENKAPMLKAAAVEQEQALQLEEKQTLHKRGAAGASEDQAKRLRSG